MESILIVVAVLYTIVLVAVVVTMYLRRNKRQPEAPVLALEEPPDEEWRKVTEIDLGGRREVRPLILRDLEAVDRRVFQDSWRALQSRAIRDPGRAVVEADRLAERLMETRGFPIREQLHGARLSEQHAAVVISYEAAHQIAEAHRREPQPDVTLREAMVHFRVLFNELLNQASHTRAA